MTSVSVVVDPIFIGQPAPLEGDGRPSAIRKHPAAGPLTLTATGLIGDAQADLRVHGGPERALCHYPREHYPGWIAAFPPKAAEFRAGGFGENLSTEGVTEPDVAIGDVFRLGSALIQISQPRMPCWKLGDRFGLDDLPRAVIESGRSGWLYRVLETGEVTPGDRLERVERPARPISVAEVWEVHQALRPELDRVADLAGLETLAAPWRKRFASRLEWLRKQPR